MATPSTETSRTDLLGSIVREHRGGLVSYAEKRLGDHGLAEDIVQEAIIRAWRNIDRLIEMDGSVKGWLVTVTRNLIVDWVRKPHSRREVVGGTYNDPSSGTEHIEAVHHAMVAKAPLRRLSPEHRAVLIHLYLCDRTIKETADILGIPAGTVKSRQHNAIRKLRMVLRTEAVA